MWINIKSFCSLVGGELLKKTFWTELAKKAAKMALKAVVDTVLGALGRKMKEASDKVKESVNVDGAPDYGEKETWQARPVSTFREPIDLNSWRRGNTQTVAEAFRQGSFGQAFTEVPEEETDEDEEAEEDNVVIPGSLESIYAGAARDQERQRRQLERQRRFDENQQMVHAFNRF